MRRSDQIHKSSMDISDLRRDSRRMAKSRRKADRRLITHAFGSPEWVENIQKNYLAWPKAERRTMERRTDDRREIERRRRKLSKQHRSKNKFSPILLTAEERRFIEDLISEKCD